MEHFYRNIEGHFNFDFLYKEMVEKASDGARFVEIGVWKGRSLSFLVTEIINSGKNIELYAVDPWEFDLYDENLQLESGDHYQEFINSMTKYNVLNRINIMKMKSEDASYYFEDNSLDFVFIDGCHEYDYVRKDIDLWLPKMKIGGVIAGHDYAGPPEKVIKAVDETFGSDKKIVGGNIWVHHVKDNTLTKNKLFHTTGKYAGVNNIDFGLSKNDRILDIGGGNKPYIHSTHVVDMLDTENQRHGKPLEIGGREFIEGDVKKVLLDYPDNYFDFCWSSHTFEHIENLPEALDIISAKCKRGFFALPASDFEFMTAKSHFGHVNLCRLIDGVLHICERPSCSINNEMAKMFEEKLFNDPSFNKIWESHNCKGLRFIWEARHYWEGQIKYKFYDDPLKLFPQLEYFM